MPSEEKQMKSAYELAMERFGQTGAGPALSAEQKQEIAEIDRETQAKIAEQEILLKSRIQAAAAAGNLEEAAKLHEELTAELRRLRERGEAKKDEVRKREG